MLTSTQANSNCHSCVSAFLLEFVPLFVAIIRRCLVLMNSNIISIPFLRNSNMINFFSSSFLRNYNNHKFHSCRRLHWPGIEPGPPAWQARILPMNHQCINSQTGNRTRAAWVKATNHDASLFTISRKGQIFCPGVHLLHGCHAGGPGSIPGRGGTFFIHFYTFSLIFYILLNYSDLI